MLAGQLSQRNTPATGGTTTPTSFWPDLDSSTASLARLDARSSDSLRVIRWTVVIARITNYRVAVQKVCKRRIKKKAHKVTTVRV